MPDPADHPPQNVILIGFMGSGKSTVGREVAAGLNFEFVDTDDLIAAESGRSIPQIFAESGESAFRDLESAALQSLTARSALVVSTGGGIILRSENRVTLKDLGFIVWLDAALDTIVERVSRNKNRPLVQTDNPGETVSRLLDERRPAYAETADLAVATEGLGVREIAHGIIESANVHRSHDSP